MAAIRGLSLAKVSSIKITFSAFDSRVASARELLRRVSSTKLRESNPKCQVVTDIHSKITDPNVEVTFSDGSSLNFNCLEQKALDMVAQINKKSRTLT